MNLPFDPVKKEEQLEEAVTRDLSRLYHRFRAAPYYGGITTSGAVGCFCYVLTAEAIFEYSNPFLRFNKKRTEQTG